ncbi:MAG: glycerol kinase GlpK [Pseudomonadota bacterium]
MTTDTFILAIDQGTTSSRAVVFDTNFVARGSAQQEFAQIYPEPGWVEHDADVIWDGVVAVCRDAISAAGITPAQIAAVGITNQRETTVVWERASGKPIHNAIVWQDRRTADICDALKRSADESMVAAKTGLRFDPYFSATKVAWILDHVPGARRRAEAGELCFGTIDSFLIHRLTGGKAHVTDATNASRTALFDIHTGDWDSTLAATFNVPAAILGEVKDCDARFGMTDPELFGVAAPIHGVAGDQQAALFGQACFEPGMIKSTYGTGCFVIANTGATALTSQNHLLTTVASRVSGETVYGLEGSIFVAGSAVQWLRDGIGLIDDARDTETLAQQSGIVDDVVVVPAFTGLGAPYWDPHARGAIFGLTRDTDRAKLSTATLQSVAYQTADLMKAMADDGIAPTTLRVDGGMVANDWYCQFLADIIRISVERPNNTESTILGAAALAGLGAGLFESKQSLADAWALDRRFEIAMASDVADAHYARWVDAVRRVR